MALDVAVVQGDEFAAANGDAGFFVHFAFDGEGGWFQHVAPAAGQGPFLVAAVADEQDAALAVEGAASDVELGGHVSLFEEHVLLQVFGGAGADEGGEVGGDLFGLFVALPVEAVGGEDQAVVRDGGQRDGVLADLGLGGGSSVVHLRSFGRIGGVAAAVRQRSGVMR